MKAEDIAKAIYIRCFDDDFKYPGVLNALRICAEENAETIEQLQNENTMQKQYNAKLLKGDIDKSNKISELSHKVYILQKKNDELKEEVEMYDFIYEGNGFKRRGLNNAIQIADYIEKLENQIEKMKSCENCINNYFLATEEPCYSCTRNYARTTKKTTDKWELAND